MPSFNPPNPYGSYFNFGGPEAAAMGSFIGGTTAMNPYVGSMSNPSGGFNPTTAEYAAQRTRQMQQDNFMAHVLRSDARASAIGGMMGSNLFGDSAMQKAFMSKIGGQGNFNEAISFLLNMPGISGAIGGSHRSLGMGALAASTSGMMLNGFGMYGGSAGSGSQWIQNQMATSVYNHVNSRFYTSAGASITGMTSGLNRDQLGGIMMMGAAQGAFAGLDMGKLDMKAGSISSFSPNKATLDKITNFTKSAAKAISSLIDIYGDSDVGSLMQKAQAITGLDFSRIGNADTMSSRLRSLRTAAMTNGFDNQSIMDLAMGGTAYGMALGARGPVAGMMSHNAAIQGTAAYRQAQQNAGAFFMAIPSAQEMSAALVRDQVGMYRDDLGARRGAIEMMIQEGTVRGSDAAALRKRVGGMNPSDVGTLDREIRDKYRIDLQSYIRTMGGPDALMNQLDEGGKANVFDMNSRDMRSRQEFNIRRMMRGRLAPAGAMGAMGDFSDLMTNLSFSTNDALLKAADAGANREALMQIVKDDVTGTLSPDKYVGAAQRLSAATGQGASAAFQFTRRAMLNNPFTARYMSAADQYAADARTRASSPVITDEMTRGFTNQGLVEGMLARMGSTDPRSIFAMIASTQGATQIIGMDSKHSMQFGRENYMQNGQFQAGKFKDFLQNLRINFKGEPGVLTDAFGTSKITREMIDGLDEGKLKGLAIRLTDPTEFGKMFSGFEKFRSSSGASMFISNANYRDAELLAPRAMFRAASELLMKAGSTSAADFLGGAANTLIDPEHRMHVIMGGKERIGDKLGRSGLESVISSAFNRLNSYDALMSLDPKDIKSMAKQSSDFGQQAMDTLSKHEAKLSGGNWYNPWSWSATQVMERSKVRDRLEALKEIGVAPSNETALKITGVLRLLTADGEHMARFEPPSTAKK